MNNIDEDTKLLVLVQWTGLLPEDMSWESWEKLKAKYNLEDKVALEAQGDVRNRAHTRKGSRGATKQHRNMSKHRDKGRRRRKAKI